MSENINEKASSPEPEPTNEGVTTKVQRAFLTSGAGLIVTIFVGLLFAAGHFIFSWQLAGDYALAIPTLSSDTTGIYYGSTCDDTVIVLSQYWASHISILFAVIVRSLLTLAVAASFIQITWFRYRKHNLSQHAVQQILRSRSNPLHVVSKGLWYKHTLLAVMVIVVIALSLVTILTPGTLEVDDAYSYFDGEACVYLTYSWNPTLLVAVYCPAVGISLICVLLGLRALRANHKDGRVDIEITMKQKGVDVVETFEDAV